MSDDHLRMFLAERDTPCPGCGYSLRGLTGTRCPECNQELRLQVGLAEPKMAAFITGLVGISIGFGFCAMLLAWVGFMYMDQGRGGPPVRDLYPLIFGVLVGGVLLWAWLRFRARVNRMEPGARWGNATIGTLLSLIGPVWFMVTVR